MVESEGGYGLTVSNADPASGEVEDRNRCVIVALAGREARRQRFPGPAADKEWAQFEVHDLENALAALSAPEQAFDEAEALFRPYAEATRSLLAETPNEAAVDSATALLIERGCRKPGYMFHSLVSGEDATESIRARGVEPRPRTHPVLSP